jgi:hypothetical protein
MKNARWWVLIVITLINLTFMVMSVYYIQVSRALLTRSERIRGEIQELVQRCRPGEGI